jgi:mannose-1-phosphate guanylyltransferase
MHQYGLLKKLTKQRLTGSSILVIKNNKFKALILAAGFGTRLKPFTEVLPKCLMPISGKPLLEIWLDQLKSVHAEAVLVNLHYKAADVRSFLNRSKFKSWISSTFEEILLGTAGTLIQNMDFFKGSTTLLAHGDNLCICDFESFIDFHFNHRPEGTQITMMTFRTEDPRSCGIVELDENNIVIGFHEKVENPPGNLANAAIYLLDPPVLEWLALQNSISDFSLEVLPQFIGKIATWENKVIMKDIGNPRALLLAQGDVHNEDQSELDPWAKEFAHHPIHSMIKEYR